MITKTPLIVAVTGGIGSGKSTVTKLFASYNVPIIDSDKIAKDLVTNDSNISKKIIEHFGDAVTDKNGVLNRAKLRELIFNNLQYKIWLEQLLHPLIIHEISNQLKSITSPYCLIIIPLLVETHFHLFYQRVLLIDCEESLQISRAMQRDNTSENDVKKIMSTQVSRKQRQQIANDIILNNGDLRHLQDEVKKLHEKYLM